MKAVKEFGAGELEMTMNIKMCSSIMNKCNVG